MSQQNNDWDILDFANQAAKFIENNFKILIGLFVVLVVGGSIWTYAEAQARKAQKEAFTELYKITKVYNEKKEGFNKAEEAEKAKNDKKKQDKAKDETDDKAVAATGDIEKDYGQVVEQLQQFIDKNPDKNASGEAALILSEIYDKYDRPEQGAQALAKILKTWNHQNVLFYVMQMRSGDLWASAGKCDQAVPFWEVVANAESFITQQAQLKLGVCLQKLGRLDEAKQWFTRIQDKDPNSAEGFSAKRYIRYLEFKSKAGDDSDDDKALNTSSENDKAS